MSIKPDIFAAIQKSGVPAHVEIVVPSGKDIYLDTAFMTGRQVETVPWKFLYLSTRVRQRNLLALHKPSDSAPVLGSGHIGTGTKEKRSDTVSLGSIPSVTGF
jgi:hypothetical protein